MQKSRYVLSLFFIVGIFMIITGCEDLGNVGSSFTDTNTSIVVDTFEVSDIGTREVTAFTGNLTFMSVGQFSDPIFGDVAATGLLRPSLSVASSTAEEPSNFMDVDATFKLRLFLNQNNIFGDSAASQEFDLIEMEQIWRERAWKINDQVLLSANPPLASFSIEKQDSIDVTLTGNWVDRYRDFFNSEEDDRDSVYISQFSGLAVVPRNSSKIIPVNVDSSAFVIENPDDDTLTVNIRDSGYKIERNNEPPGPGDSEIIHSSLEQILEFDMELNLDRLGTLNLSRVELVLFQNKQLLDESLDQVSPTASRPRADSAVIYVDEPANLPFAVDPGIRVGNVNFVQKDRSFRFNITSFVNSVITTDLPAEDRFFVKLNSNDGLLRSSLIFNQDAPEGKKPILIVTSIQNKSSTN